MAVCDILGAAPPLAGSPAALARGPPARLGGEGPGVGDRRREGPDRSPRQPPVSQRLRPSRTPAPRRRRALHPPSGRDREEEEEMGYARPGPLRVRACARGGRGGAHGDFGARRKHVRGLGPLAVCAEHLPQCQAHFKCPTNICGMNE
ncbi:putative HTLV-1-related endogenous sequence isoform X1 [Gorilla gorilla gorilla]|uniref:putative HTLV-1-related endogenous sequence isoform X1 n=1 Tax=Gorilla gorilla gorilla TaxID=9595 RepID=UPI00300A514B